MDLHSGLFGLFYFRYAVEKQGTTNLENNLQAKHVIWEDKRKRALVPWTELKEKMEEQSTFMDLSILPSDLKKMAFIQVPA